MWRGSKWRVRSKYIWWNSPLRMTRSHLKGQCTKTVGICWNETALRRLVQLCTIQAAMAQCSHKDCLQKCHEGVHSSSPPSSSCHPAEQRQSKQFWRAKLNSKRLVIEAHTTSEQIGGTRNCSSCCMSIRDAAMVNFISFSIPSPQNNKTTMHLDTLSTVFWLNINQSTALDMNANHELTARVAKMDALL